MTCTPRRWIHSRAPRLRVRRAVPRSPRVLRPLVELLPLVSAAFLQVLERECGRQLAVAEWLRHEVRAQDLPAVEATIARLESVQRAAHAEVVRRMVSTPAGRIQ